jgi:hypothetical protein
MASFLSGVEVIDRPTIFPGIGFFRVSVSTSSFTNRTKTSINYINLFFSTRNSQETVLKLSKSPTDPNIYVGDVWPITNGENYFFRVAGIGIRDVVPGVPARGYISIEGASSMVGAIRAEFSNEIQQVSTGSPGTNSVDVFFLSPYLPPNVSDTMFFGISVETTYDNTLSTTFNKISSANLSTAGSSGVVARETITGLQPNTTYYLTAGVAGGNLSSHPTRYGPSTMGSNYALIRRSTTVSVRTAAVISKPDPPFVFSQDARSLTIRIDVSNVTGFRANTPGTAKFYINMGNTPTNLVRYQASQRTNISYEVKFNDLIPSTRYYFKTSIVDDDSKQTVMSDLAIYETSFGETFYIFKLSDDGTYYTVNGHELGNTALTGKITIPSSYLGKPVSYIGANAFKNYSITGVIIPETILGIGNSAFEDCIYLTDILTIPTSVTTIGSRAFAGSNISGPLTIPYSVTSVGSEAFRACPLITVVNILEGIPTFGSGAFRACIAIESVIIRTTIVTIPDNAFKDCNGLRSLDIVNGVEHIGASAFENCISIAEQLLLPSTIKTIGDSAFKNCTNLTGSLVLPELLTNIGANAFNGCNLFTGMLIIPNTVTNIGDSAFEDCAEFNNLVLSRDLTTIGSRAFRGCTGLGGSLVIPMLVTNIGNSAFENCSGFGGTLTLSFVLQNIGDDAFRNCTNFTGTLFIPDNVFTVGNRAFYNCNNFTGNLFLGNNVTSIGDSAFELCNNMNGSLIIGNNVRFIGNSAFLYCNFDGVLNIPNSVVAIGSSAFRNCIRFIGNLVIPDSVQSIGTSAFRNCTGFKGTLTVGKGLTIIDDEVFSECNGFIGNLVIPDNIKRIGRKAFFECAKFNGRLDITPLVQRIGESAFQNCVGFTELVNRDLTRTTIVELNAFEGTSLSYF